MASVLTASRYSPIQTVRDLVPSIRLANYTFVASVNSRHSAMAVIADNATALANGLQNITCK